MDLRLLQDRARFQPARKHSPALKRNRHCRFPFPAGGGFPLPKRAECRLIENAISGRLDNLDVGHVSPGIEI